MTAKARDTTACLVVVGLGGFAVVWTGLLCREGGGRGFLCVHTTCQMVQLRVNSLGICVISTSTTTQL